jgi:Protein of Unknown function (DUF2784)
MRLALPTPDMTTAWRWLGDAVVALHIAYLVYVLVGGFVAWRWPKTIVLHAIAVLWAILTVATPVECPLTTLQEEFRRLAAQAPLHGGFVDVYIKGRLYPADRPGLAQIVVGVVVASSWIGLAARHYRQARPRQAPPYSPTGHGPDTR